MKLVCVRVHWYRRGEGMDAGCVAVAWWTRFTNLDSINLTAVKSEIPSREIHEEPRSEFHRLARSGRRPTHRTLSRAVSRLRCATTILTTTADMGTSLRFICDITHACMPHELSRSFASPPISVSCRFLVSGLDVTSRSDFRAVLCSCSRDVKDITTNAPPRLGAPHKGP